MLHYVGIIIWKIYKQSIWQNAGAIPHHWLKSALLNIALSSFLLAFNKDSREKYKNSIYYFHLFEIL